MSRAFVSGDSDDMWLHDVQPTLNALISYLTRENNGVRVYEKENYFDDKIKRQVHHMSDGFIYSLNDERKWYITNE